MKRKHQVYQTDSEENPFEISTTSEDSISIKKKNENHISACGIILILFGLLICIDSIVNAIVLFYLPYIKIKENKRKYKEAEFEKLPKFRIAIHFIIHSLVFIFGCIIILSFYLNDFDLVGFALVLYLILVAWFIQGSNCPSNDYNVDLYIDDLFKIINNNPPLDSINVQYINTFSSSINTNNYYTNIFRNYSQVNVKIPIYTNMISKIYKYDDFPDVFYLTINQNINLSSQLLSYFQNALNIEPNINFVSKKYLVSKDKKLNHLSKKTRIVSHIFGVGIYYVLYSKSIPSMIIKEILHAELIPKFNQSKAL